MKVTLNFQILEGAKVSSPQMDQLFNFGSTRSGYDPLEKQISDTNLEKKLDPDPKNEPDPDLTICKN